MAGITHGMNIEEVEELGRYLSTRASREVESARQQVDRRISSVQWAGPESDRFRREVWPVRRDQLRSISEELRQFGDKALEDARQQLEASGASAGAGPSGLPLVCRVPEGSSTAVLADQMRNGQPGPQDLVMARLADGQTPPGWEKLSDDQLRAAGLDPSRFNTDSGLTSMLYRNEAGDVVLVFRGSQSRTDWINNGNQFLGVESAQYEDAVALARSVKAVYGNDLVITGHSLGGGLASLSALATNSPAVTFNPAAVHDGSLVRAGLEPESARSSAMGLVRVYSMEGDPLGEFQMASNRDSRAELGSITTIDNGQNQIAYMAGRVAPILVPPVLNPIGVTSSAAGSLERHSMEYMLTTMESDPRFADRSGGGGGGGGGSW